MTSSSQPKNTQPSGFTLQPRILIIVAVVLAILIVILILFLISHGHSQQALHYHELWHAIGWNTGTLRGSSILAQEQL
jgi:hypothetical protein